MIRNLDYKITQEADSILSFLKEHGYSFQLNRTFEKNTGKYFKKRYLELCE